MAAREGRARPALVNSWLLALEQSQRAEPILLPSLPASLPQAPQNLRTASQHSHVRAGVGLSPDQRSGRGWRGRAGLLSHRSSPEGSQVPLEISHSRDTEHVQVGLGCPERTPALPGQLLQGSGKKFFPTLSWNLLWFSLRPPLLVLSRDVLELCWIFRSTDPPQPCLV